MSKISYITNLKVRFMILVFHYIKYYMGVGTKNNVLNSLELFEKRLSDWFQNETKSS